MFLIGIEVIILGYLRIFIVYLFNSLGVVKYLVLLWIKICFVVDGKVCKLL